MVKNDKWIEYDQSGDLKIDGMYKNGNPFNGLFKGEFYFDGEKAEEKINYFSDGVLLQKFQVKG